MIDGRKVASMMTHFRRTGRRAQSAAEQLRQLGYTRLSAMTGGYDDLEAAGYPSVE